MGAEGFLIAAALQAVVAQRLVRRICDSCAQPYQPTEQERVWLESACGVAGGKIESRLAAGCQRCNHTGYRGRIGVYELLEPDYAMLSALRAGDSVAFTEAVHNNKQFRPMRFNALDYVRAGITSIEEMMRISSERVEDDAALREPKATIEITDQSES
jgi:MSHA biogenesis protein MshE